MRLRTVALRAQGPSRRTHNGGGGTSLEHSRKRPLAQGHGEEKDTANKRKGTPQRDTQEGAAPAHNKHPEAEGEGEPAKPAEPAELAMLEKRKHIWETR